VLGRAVCVEGQGNESQLKCLKSECMGCGARGNESQLKCLKSECMGWCSNLELVVLNSFFF